MGLHLEALLGALAPGSLVLLFIGFDGSAGLQASNTSIRAILLQTADIVNDADAVSATFTGGWEGVRCTMASFTPEASSSPGGGGGRSEVAPADIDRLIFTARVQGLPDSLPRLPWESGVMAMIFVPKPLVVQPCAPSKDTPTIDGDPILASSSRARPAPSTLYERSFASRADVPVQEEDEHLWVMAVGKWCSIFALAHSDPGQVGEQAAQCFAAEGEAARDELLRDVFGLRSPRTAIKRANALLRCFRWHQREHDTVWPWGRPTITAYVRSLGDSVSAVSGLFEAMNFAHHVMGLPLPGDLLADRRLQGRAKRLVGDKPETRQQVPLTVEAVAKLERLVAGRNLCDADTYVLGGLLFALYSRSRWSDLKQIQSIRIDFDDSESVSGFVEARTREHKTSNTVRTKRRAMPLVAPFPGVTESRWVAAWQDAGREPWCSLGKRAFRPASAGTRRRWPPVCQEVLI